MLLRTPLATSNNTPSPSKPPGSTIILLHSASWNLFFENLFFANVVGRFFKHKQLCLTQVAKGGGRWILEGGSNGSRGWSNGGNC